MKILYLTHALPKFPGDRVTVFIRELALAFKRAGHEITILAPSHPGLNYGYLRSLFAFETYRYFPLKRFEILGYGDGMSDGIRQNKLNFILGPFLVICGILKCILLTRKYQPDLLFANWGLPNGFIGAIAAFLFKKKLIITYPGADVKLISSAPIYRLFSRVSADVAHLLTTNSSDLRDALLKAGLPENKLHLVIYGADAQTFFPSRKMGSYYRELLGIDVNTIVIGSIGRFVDKKGFSYFIESASLILRDKFLTSRVQFVLFGAGENEEKLKHQAEVLNLRNKLLMPGTVPPEMLNKVYNFFDIFVNPATRDPIDGLNVVVPEAMACAKPIVATNVCGNDIVVSNGENGLLVSQRNPETLAEAIEKLIRDEKLRKEMGALSHRRFVERFSWERIVDQYINLIR